MRESFAAQYSLLCVSLVSVALATQQQAAWSWSLRDSVRNPLLLFYYYCSVIAAVLFFNFTPQTFVSSEVVYVEELYSACHFIGLMRRAIH